MKHIRFHLTIFILLLLFSGITAFPIQTEILFLYLHKESLPGFLDKWLEQLVYAIDSTPR